MGWNSILPRRGVTLNLKPVSSALRTRSAASRGFVSMHILVPDKWSVQHGHKTAEQIETEIRSHIPQIAIFTNVEPVEDSISWEDSQLEKE